VRSILMTSQLGLTSARRNTGLSCDSQTILAGGAAALVQQVNPAHFQVETGRWFAPIALPATDVPAVRSRVGDSYAATTKHIGNGGLRGPQPWGHPPVIT
jgi:hypothetical protein